MKVLYESLQTDFTELCDQYGTVMSSILEKHVPEMRMRKSLYHALWYNNEIGSRKQFVYFTSDYQSYANQRLVVKIQFLKQRMIISLI